ncbi:MAG: hypothetical protein E7413_03360 [Ruminococcaceae bacterium]|nr:hypothetical protein [Oscillospiraceae bacterium]
MKKILSLLLALPVSMALITGCGSDNSYQPQADIQTSPLSNAPTPTPASPSEDASEEAKKDAIYKYLQEKSNYQALEKILSVEEQEYQDEIVEFVDELYREMITCQFHQFLPVQNETDAYTVEVEITQKNFDDFNINNAIENASEFINVDSVIEKLVLTEDMSEDEAYKELFPAMLDEMKNNANEFLKDAKQNDPIFKTFKVTKVDENWTAQEI